MRRSDSKYMAWYQVDILGNDHLLTRSRRVYQSKTVLQKVQGISTSSKISEIKVPISKTAALWRHTGVKPGVSPVGVTLHSLVLALDPRLGVVS